MIPKILKNFNLFVDGRGYAGRVEELTLPKLSIKTEEIKNGGMDIPIEVDMGMEKLECEFTLSEYDEEVIKLFGLRVGVPNPLTLRGAQDSEKGVVAVVISLDGVLRSLDFGNWKAGEKATLKVNVALRYYRLEIDGKELVEIDASNMIRKINCNDQLDDIRNAIGV